MIQYRSIEIDFDVHQEIEKNRRSFDETPNDVLRRKLGLGTVKKPAKPLTAATPEARPWRGHGIELPHGTELRMKYNHFNYTGRIENGAWIVKGETFYGPSAAASGVAVTKKGKKTRLNGWMYWEAKVPTDKKWRPLWEFRIKARTASF